MPEIIRQGDPTSHGGYVLEGSVTDICHGKPIAYIGHKVSCPKCKGTYPIVEGVTTTTFYGKGVALAGMKTSCGAVLIATQFTDTVEWSAGGSRAADAGLNGSNSRASTAAVPQKKNDSSSLFDDKFVLRDQHGEPIAHVAYAILRASGAVEYGESDESGHTHLLAATAESEAVHIYLAG